MTKETERRIWDDVTLEDLPSDMQEVARECGLDVVRYLVNTWGGVQLYIPSASRVTRPTVERFILDEWNGRNEGELSRRYGLSRKVIYDILKGDRKTVVSPQQQDMFGGESAG
ncbi:MAG: Mor transcription activator family protein [Bacteroidota bacterium]